MQSIDKNSPQKKPDNIQQQADGSQKTTEALEQAEKDISNDPDLSDEPDPADDLDEGELARLEGED